MAFDIDDPETERLARELAATTGEAPGQAVEAAVRERHARLNASADTAQLVDFMNMLSARAAGRPVRDDRTDDEILGYDDHGLPG